MVGEIPVDFILQKETEPTKLLQKDQIELAAGSFRGFVDSGDWHAACSIIYSIDCELYSECKYNDSQGSYIKYQSSLSMLVNSCFENNYDEKLKELLHRRALHLISNLKQSSKLPKASLLFVVSNTSTLAHINVLKRLLCFASRHYKIYVYFVFPQSSQSIEVFRSFIANNGVTLLYSKVFKDLDYVYLIACVLTIKPDLILWWAWPPGKWISLLMPSNFQSINVCFKYDIAPVGRFSSHLYSCGLSYAKTLCHDGPDLLPFHLFFDATELEQAVDRSCNRNAKKTSLPARDNIVYGILAREEKVAQPEYLECVARIISKVPNSLFYWTGRECRPSVTSFFRGLGLLNKTKWLGYVTPRKFFSLIDVYLDAFPMGSGFTYVQAGICKKPIIAMECSDSIEPRLSYQLGTYLDCNNINKRLYSHLFCQTQAEYIDHAVKIGKTHGNQEASSNDVSGLFYEAFCSDKLPLSLLQHITALTSSH